MEVRRTDRQTSKLLLLQDAASSRKPPLAGPTPGVLGSCFSDASLFFLHLSLYLMGLDLFTHLHPDCVMSPLWTVANLAL